MHAHQRAQKVLVHLDSRTVALEVGIRQGVCNGFEDCRREGPRAYGWAFMAEIRPQSVRGSTERLRS